MLYFLNSIGIDTIRFLISTKILYKFLNGNDLVMEDYTKNAIIDNYFQTKEVKQNRDYEVKIIKIGKTQNLSSYILIKQNLESVTISKRRKKSKSYYSEIIFAGLRQPTKNINLVTYEILSLFIKRFKVSNLDICFDGLNEIDINKSNFYKLADVFEKYINSFDDVRIEQTSFYINEVSSRLEDTDKFIKMLAYDKYAKESRYKKLDDELKNWKRLEVTLKVEFKFKGFNLKDYIKDVEVTAKKYFNTLSFSYDYLNLQSKLLTDRRTHKRVISL